jgi:dTDP-4-dehydrorhamnose reductase
MVVADEWGNPTWDPFLAEDICQLLEGNASIGVYHIVNGPPTSRFGWAKSFLPPTVALEAISRSAFDRPSVAPPRAVLSSDLAIKIGIRPRSWIEPSRRLAASLA